ncbi:hypothetical protein [Microlunatus parietis]|uniref:Uncharacterized protein n=1 Tax=Microlunatus parietis TaxID=682979 RepID=A0A7Y9LEU3_9ACTN|nr:hypothetical protein [Microlunatus parietis]NYE73396.1 hypothetical protein [Microlunatus parietis]
MILYASEQLRGGVWAAVAAHAGFNGAGALLPADGDVAVMIELGVMIILAAVVHALSQASNKSS